MDFLFYLLALVAIALIIAHFFVKASNGESLFKAIKKELDQDQDDTPSRSKKSEKDTSAHIPCLICGADAGNKHFCYSCYSKHKNHDIIVKISKCKDVTVEEKYAEGQRYVCKDGHIVRSKSERDIDNFLFDNRIFHAYEKKFDVDGEDTVRPDFYIPTKDLYIEHWGLDNERYQKEKEYKLNVYRKQGITVICTYEEDMEDFEFNLKRKLSNYKFNEINYLK